MRVEPSGNLCPQGLVTTGSLAALTRKKLWEQEEGPETDFRKGSPVDAQSSMCTFDAHTKIGDQALRGQRGPMSHCKPHWELKVKAQTSVMFFQGSWQSSSHPLLPTS